MEVSAKSCARRSVVTTFNLLPSTVKEKIFLFLDKKSRGLARGVCIHWALFLRGYFGVHLVITDVNSEFLMNIPKYGKEVREMTLMDWTTLPYHYRSFRLTKFLRTLEVCGEMSPFTVLKFLSHCDRLEHLIFTACIFQKLTQSDLDVDGKEFKPKPKLKSIKINTCENKWNFSEDDLFVFELLKHYDLKNLVSFDLRRQNSSISTKCDFNISGKKNMRFHLGGIIRLDESSSVLKSITKIVQKSSATLKILHLENIAELLFDRKGSEVKMPQLQELSGVIRYKFGWGSLLAAQKCLTTLRLEFLSGFWEDVKGYIRTCATTLKELHLIGFYGIEPEYTVDLNFLKTLPKLKSLHVECSRGLISVKEFPPSLKSLCLHAPFSRSDFIHFVLSFTNLKRFCLMDYGYNTSDGELYSHLATNIFDLDQFQYLLRAPKIQKIVFQHCMMLRMKIINYCKEVGIDVKSQVATVGFQTIGYMYNMEANVTTREKFDRIHRTENIEKIQDRLVST